MKNTITSLAILLLAAAGAQARGHGISGARRGAGRAVGRATFHAAPSRRAAAPSSAPSGISAPRSSPGGSSSGGTRAFTTYNGRSTGSGFSGGMRGFSVGRSRTSSSSSRGGFWFGRSLGVAARRTSPDSGGSTDVPPNYTKPGALIRSEGQLPVYSDPGNARTHSVEGGGFIAQESGKARDSNRSPGVTWGRPDTMPGAAPAGSSAISAGGVTANGPSVTVNNSHSNNVNGNQHAGGGNGDNGNHYGGSSFDPSF